MNIIERLRKQARASVTSAEIFVSKHMQELLGSKVRHICRDYKVATPSLKLLFDEKSELTACASMKDVTINCGHPAYSGDDETRLLKVSGTLIHELGHILFTNYTAHNLWERDMAMGMYYPSAPDVDPDLEQARYALTLLASGPMSRAFLNYAHNIANILEDGRMENFVMKYIRNARFMIKGLVAGRADDWAEMLDFEEISQKVSAGEMEELIAMQNLIFIYAKFRDVKGQFDPKSDLGKRLVRLIPDIETYLEATEAVVYLQAFSRILIILGDLIEEYLSKKIDEQQSLEDKLKELLKELSGMAGGPSQGDSQGEQQRSSESSSGNSSGNADAGSDANSSENSEGSDGSGSAGSSESSDGSGSDVGNASADGGSDGDSKSGQAISPTPEEQAAMEAAASSIGEDLKEALKELKGQSVDQSSNMGDQAKGSDRGSVKRRIAGLAKGEGGKVATPNAAEADNGTGTITHEQAEDINLNLVLDDIARKIADAETEGAISKEIRSDYQSVARDVKDYASIHKNCDITMYHYSDVSQADIEAYNKIALAVAPAVKRAVKSSNFYDKDYEAYTEDNLFSGSTLHAERSYRRDGKIFSKTYDKEEPPRVAVAVRIDCSGSMSGSRIEAARRCCVFLYEYCLGMEKRYGVKIPLYIYGDSVSGRVRMFVFADDKYRTSNEKYRLMKLAAGGCNRDGLPIRMAVKRLEQEQPYAQKVIFNITDGQPNDHEYGGEPAFDDLRDITRYCEKKRIALAACAIGSDKETIEHIYGSNHFLNISNLDELPVRLVKILKKLLK